MKIKQIKQKAGYEISDSKLLAFIGCTHAVLCFRRNLTKQSTTKVKEENIRWLLVKKTVNEFSINFEGQKIITSMIESESG